MKEFISYALTGVLLAVTLWLALLDYKAIVTVIVIGCTVAVVIWDAINKAKRKNRRKHK